MKLLYTLILSFILTLTVQAQQDSILLTFRDTTVINQLFYTDSLLDSTGIWQIGTSDKPFFDSAFGISTGIDSALKPGTKAAFVITIPPVRNQNDAMGGLFSFVHKYDFDSIHSGGYVEYSVDSGNHWHGVLAMGANQYHDGPSCIQTNYQMVDGQYIYIPTWWSVIPQDTTPSGIACFSGTDRRWLYDSIVIGTPFGEKTNHLTYFLFRFTAYADTLAGPHAGWMIDSIAFHTHVFQCPGGINEVNSSHLKVNPIPATSAFTISMLDEPESDYTITVSDISGRVVLTQRFTGQETMIQRGDIDAGSYFIQVTDKRTQNTFQKRMVFE